MLSTFYFWKMDRIKKLLELLEQMPGDDFLQHALALEYIKAGDDDGAKILFENILKQSPGYIGSYYHLGKLLERNEKKEEAIHCYETGMQQAKIANDSHAYNELRAAYEDLVF